MASCAYAQAPSPADVGIVKGPPTDTFKLLDSSKTWTPFGTVNPSTCIFMRPATNGSIAPNDCIKWGPGLTSAGAACNSVTGGATPANQLTIYTNHDGLVNNVTTPTEAWTVQQQGFYAPGDGGGATYQWSFTSYCALGTSGAPTPADGIVCVLPVGQSPTVAGRYLLATNGVVDVRQVGMKAGGASFDNSPYVQGLMSAMGPPIFNTPSAKIVFPASLGQSYTSYYYFSQPLVLSRSGIVDCQTNVAGIPGSVALVFPPGVDGVRQESGYLSPDTGWGQAEVRGCHDYVIGQGVRHRGFNLSGRIMHRSTQAARATGLPLAL